VVGQIALADDDLAELLRRGHELVAQLLQLRAPLEHGPKQDLLKLLGPVPRRRGLRLHEGRVALLMVMIMMVIRCHDEGGGGQEARTTVLRKSCSDRREGGRASSWVSVSNLGKESEDPATTAPETPTAL
jgi:hypothetical protein